MSSAPNAARPGWGTDPAENKLFFSFFFLFPPGISVQLDPFPDPLHLAAAQMLVLAEGAAARARRRQPLLDALTADPAPEHPLCFNRVGFVSKLKKNNKK